jgi:hypothetical protein
MHSATIKVTNVLPILIIQYLILLINSVQNVPLTSTELIYFLPFFPLKQIPGFHYTGFSSRLLEDENEGGKFICKPGNYEPDYTVP